MAYTEDSQILVIRQSGELTTGSDSYPSPQFTRLLEGGRDPARYPTIITRLWKSLGDGRAGSSIKVGLYFRVKINFIIENCIC